MPPKALNGDFIVIAGKIAEDILIGENMGDILLHLRGQGIQGLIDGRNPVIRKG